MKQPKGQCGFLTEERLCEIHRDLGEEYLCVTYTQYPRHINWIDDHIEESLQLSCPEAARIILLNEECMSFEYEVEQKWVRDILLIK